MKKQGFNSGWEFSYGGNGGFFERQPLDFKPVQLPHDFLISKDVTPDAASGGNTGYYPGDKGTYRKTFTIDELPGKAVLNFDGVYRDAHVKLNGSHMTIHHYGYTPFFADVTKYLKVGENTLIVTADTTPEGNSRWYTGGGIFREVTLITGGPRYFCPVRGVWIRTDSVEGGVATVSVDVYPAGAEPTAEETVKFTVLAPDGSEVKTFTATPTEASAAATFTVEDPQLWDLDAPNLYTLKCELLSGEEVIDETSSTFGIRTIEIDAKNGFRLNGKRIILQGGCVHHDNGPLGAVSTLDIELRRVQKLKEGGYHAIRTAHNPPSLALIEACDRLGMLVMDEAFDMWVAGKNPYDYHINFIECWQQDIAAMVLRDRSHPSVFMWSIGNEILDQWIEKTGIDWMKRLAAQVRKFDSTRMITMGGIFVDAMKPEKHAEYKAYCERNGFADAYEDRMNIGDIASTLFGVEAISRADVDEIENTLGILDLHYDLARYPSLCEEHPNAIIVGSETFAKEAPYSWQLMRDYPQIIGDFVWTAWDYIGEAGCGSVRYFSDEQIEAMGGMPQGGGFGFTTFPIGYPFRLAHDGDFDLLGYDRPLGHFRQAVWGSPETYVCAMPPKYMTMFEDISKWTWPEVKHSWSWPGDEGKTTRVEVYSSAEEVELLLDGESLGKKPAGRAANYRTCFDVTYAPGTLTAISYTAGKEVSRDEISTVGEAVAIELKPETCCAKACPKSFIYVNVEFVDADGKRVPTVTQLASAKVEGAATLASFASSAAETTENYTAGIFTSREGRLQAILRSNGESGTAKLIVSAEGYLDATVEVNFK